MTFPKWVSLEAVLRAGFNYWEPSLGLDKNGKKCTVYHTKFYMGNANLVVLEYLREHSDGYKRREFFFRTFPGKHSGEYETLEEAEPFFEELRKTFSRKYRIPGKDLEERILQSVKEIESEKVTLSQN